MKTQILCIGGSDKYWRRRGKCPEDGECSVVLARDDQEAVALLQASAVDVICIDSELLARAPSSALGMSLKATQPHIPVVLIQTGDTAPAHFEEYVDVVVDEFAFSTLRHRLITELRKFRFPLFAEWFDSWRQRTAGPEQIPYAYVESLKSNQNA